MNNLEKEELKKKNAKRYSSLKNHSSRYQMMALSSSLLWFLGCICGSLWLLMEQGLPRKYGCLEGA